MHQRRQEWLYKLKRELRRVEPRLESAPSDSGPSIYRGAGSSQADPIVHWSTCRVHRITFSRSQQSKLLTLDPPQGMRRAPFAVILHLPCTRTLSHSPRCNGKRGHPIPVRSCFTSVVSLISSVVFHIVLHSESIHFRCCPLQMSHKA